MTEANVARTSASPSGYEREHDCDIARLKGFPRRADHWSVN